MTRSGEHAFDILVREHHDGLLAFARSCVYDTTAADDIVQETFLVAWRQLGQCDQARPFGEWLRGIAKHKILEHYRSSETAKRHVRILTPEQLEAVAGEFTRLVPGSGHTFPDRLAALRECLATLRAEDHDIVERAYRRKQTCSAIANQLGQSAEAIRKRLQRARSELRDCILGKLKLEAANG